MTEGYGKPNKCTVIDLCHKHIAETKSRTNSMNFYFSIKVHIF